MQWFVGSVEFRALRLKFEVSDLWVLEVSGSSLRFQVSVSQQRKPLHIMAFVLWATPCIKSAESK